jgi:hypothetical protein
VRLVAISGEYRERRHQIGHANLGVELMCSLGCMTSYRTASESISRSVA